MKLYLKSNKKNYNAVAEYEPNTKRFIVKKGSILSKNVVESKTFRGSKKIKTQRENNINSEMVTIKDIEFKSSSTAANFVTGRSTNGRIAWKDENGKKLKDLL